MLYLNKKTQYNLCSLIFIIKPAIIKNSEITGNHLIKNYFRLMDKIFGK
jgi:hypothetical protein